MTRTRLSLSKLSNFTLSNFTLLRDPLELPFATARTIEFKSSRAPKFIAARSKTFPLYRFFALFSFPSFFLLFLRQSRKTYRDRRRTVRECYRSLRANVRGTSTEILSTVDRVIARISALDCDGRDWASPREAVLPWVAPAPTALYPHSPPPPPPPRVGDISASLAPSLLSPPFASAQSRASLLRLVPSPFLALTCRLALAQDCYPFSPRLSTRTRTILLCTSFTRKGGSLLAVPSPSDSICRPAESFCWIQFVTRHHSLGIRIHCWHARGTLSHADSSTLFPVRVQWLDL